MSDSIWVRETFSQTTKCFARSTFPTVHAITESTFCIIQIRAKLIHTNAVFMSQCKALDLRWDWKRSRSSIDLTEGDKFSESWVLSIGPLLDSRAKWDEYENLIHMSSPIDIWQL